jgi:hypothetical protein
MMNRGHVSILVALMPAQEFNASDHPHLKTLFDGGKSGVAKSIAVTDLAFSSQCQRLFIATKGALLLYDVLQEHLPLQTHSDVICTIDASGALLASASMDVVRLWSAKTGKKVGEWRCGCCEGAGIRNISCISLQPAAADSALRMLAAGDICQFVSHKLDFNTFAVVTSALNGIIKLVLQAILKEMSPFSPSAAAQLITAASACIFSLTSKRMLQKYRLWPFSCFLRRHCQVHR